MTAAETLLEQALRLPAPDRALVASGLLASLDEGADANRDDVERWWTAETERRVKQLDAGETKLVPMSEVVDHIAGQRSPSPPG